MSVLTYVLPPRHKSVRDPLDRRYWLTHCEGFRVDCDGGRLGFVEEVRPRTGYAPPVLAVRAGRLGRRLLLVDAGDVSVVVPRTQRVYLHSSPRILGSVAA